MPDQPTPTKPIRVAIIDDQQLFLDGITSLLGTSAEVEVVGSGRHGKAALTICEGVHPEIMLLDLSMPDEDGLSVLRQLRTAFPDLKVIMLTVHEDFSTIQECMKQGARGYMLKINGKEELLRALRDVAAGRKYLDPKVLDDLIGQEFSGAKSAVASPITRNQVVLTPREVEVLRLLAQGKTSIDISTELFISTNTVDTHRKTIIGKLDARNITHAVNIAINRELI